MDVYNLPFRFPEISEGYEIFDYYFLYEETIGVKVYMIYDRDTSKYKFCLITERPHKQELPLYHI